MATRTIKTYPDPVLLRPAAPVEKDEFGPKLDALIADMAETMYVSHGIGLAAPQIAVSKRILVIDIDWPDHEDSVLHQLINPEIIEGRGDTIYPEGCLSFPGLICDIKRHEEVTLRAQDPSGAWIQIEADGLLAICIQHEMDHLDGITLADRAEGADREQLMEAIKSAPWFRPELLSENPTL
jgi:peptide deformylase